VWARLGHQKQGGRDRDRERDAEKERQGKSERKREGRDKVGEGERERERGSDREICRECVCMCVREKWMMATRLKGVETLQRTKSLSIVM